MQIEFNEEGRIMPFWDQGFLEPHMAPRGERDILFQRTLDRLVDKGAGRKGEPGELIRLTKMGPIEWDATTFDIRTGQQMGWVGCYYTDQKEVPVYTTAVAMSSRYSGRNYGYLAAKYMWLMLASLFPDGVEFREPVAAKKEHQPAVESNLTRLGAKLLIKDPKNGESLWVKFQPHVDHPIPTSVSAESLVFQGLVKNRQIPFSSGLTQVF